MNTYVLLSFDLKQNTATENRNLFDEHLEGCGWMDHPDVSSTKTKAFSGGDAEGSKITALMEVYEAAIHARVKETSFVIQCGNLKPISKTFLHPRFLMLTTERFTLS